MKLIIFFLLVVFNCQAQKKITLIELDSIISINTEEIKKYELDKKLPTRVISFLSNYANSYQIKDWQIITVLKSYCNSLKFKKNDSKAELMCSLLTSLKINNALVTSKNKKYAFVSISNKVSIINLSYLFESGYKLLNVFNDDKIIIRKLEFHTSTNFIDLSLDYSLPVEIVEDSIAIRHIQFVNYLTEKNDSFSYYVSINHVKYLNTLPRVKPDKRYSLAPLSNVLSSSLFNELNKRIHCNNLEDSLNFLLRFVTNGITQKNDIDLYNKNDWPAFPENTLELQSGDCEDVSELYLLLIRHYFSDVEVIFLIHPNHINLGIYNHRLITKNKVSISYKNKQFLIADPSSVMFFPLGSDIYLSLTSSILEIW